MKKKFKKSLIVTSALSASLFNTPALITDAMAHAAETNANEKTADASKNNLTNNTNTENKNQISTENNTAEKNTTTENDDKVSKDSSIGPGYYDQSEVKAKSLLSAFSTAVPASTSSFISSVSNGAINGWKKYKVLPSVTIAQAILESAWGGSALTTKANNLFGIKGRYNGQYVTMPTWEVINGQSVMVNAEFRKYPSRDVSMEDHGNFLTVNSRYKNLIGVTNYKTVTKLLQQDGYATDPAYPSKLNSIIETYGLTKYDSVAVNASNGSLDSSSFTGKNLKVKGWHISQESNGKPYSFIFLIDNSTGKEVQRVKINRTQRNDVYNAYPNIANSRNSGFDTSFKLDDSMYGKSYTVMSRYSSDPSGNSNVSDYKFANSVNIPGNGSLNNLSASQTSINARGWHVSNNATDKPYSYLFLLDANTKAEVKRIKIDRTQRSDVQSVFPDVTNSDKSGFEKGISLDANMYNKKYVLMSRYSDDPSGNGKHVDYMYNQTVTTPELATKASSMDTFKVTSKNIHIKGWQVDNESKGKPYSYAFMIDANTGKEVKRFKIDRQKRPDVKAAYPTIYNSENSGFDLNIPVTDDMRGHSYKFILRYSADKDGNVNNANVTFNNTAKIADWEKGNYASINEATVTGKDIHVRGWHATSDSKNKPYSYLFLLDAKTKTEIKRYPINRTERTDVSDAFPNILNSDKSGFDNNLSLDKSMYGKEYILMSRYTDDPKGNGRSVDYMYDKKITTPTLATKAASLDNLIVSGKTIHVKGWQADNNSVGKPYSYVIMLDTSTGREYKRFKINRVERKDVENAYPFIYNSKDSGFNIDIPITSDMKGHNYKYLIRYSTGIDGNGSNADVTFSSSTTI